MVDYTKIHAFAEKYLALYKSLETKDHEVEKEFADECFAFGFKMDCGESFIAAFPECNPFSDAETLTRILDQVDDVMLLGSAIFSQWRYITHWDWCGNLLSEENRQWFIAAFIRLSELTAQTEDTVCGPELLRGKPRKIRIVSNGIGYGPCPMPDEEVEQRITFYDDGRVWFSGYNFGEGFDKYVRGRSSRFKIEKDKASCIFDAYERFFSTDYEYIIATDIGSWEMTITNTEDENFHFKGSLCAEFKVEGIDLSELLRDELGIDNLWVFDGDNKPDRVDRVVVDYHRVTKIKPKQPVSDTAEFVTWNYTEQLVLDRESETIEYIQNIGTGCKLSRKYYVEGGVEGLLDDIDAYDLFGDIEGNPPDIIETPNETKDYTITVDFKKGPQRVIQGSYDKKGLPEGWGEFANDVFEFLRFYGFGELLDPSVYGKAKRRKAEYIYCSVTFDEGYKSYYYIADDDSIEIGDFVLVPVGQDNHHAVVEVVNLEYFLEEEVPLPLDKTKHIIRKCTQEDFDPPENETN